MQGFEQESNEEKKEGEGEEEKKGQKEDVKEGSVWLNFKEAPDTDEQTIDQFIQFVLIYNHDPTITAGKVTVFKEFVTLRELLVKLNLREPLFLDLIYKSVCQKNQILVLIDIGGSILYRSSERLVFPSSAEGGNVKRNPDF